MGIKQTGIEVPLPDGRVVVLVELSIEQEKRAARLASTEHESTRGFEVGLQGLRLAIRKVNDQEVKYEDLIGDKLEETFGTRNVKILARIYQKHFGVEGSEFEAVTGNVKAIAF